MTSEVARLVRIDPGAAPEELDPTLNAFIFFNGFANALQLSITR